MSPVDFVTSYNLHDSLLEGIEYNQTEKSLCIDIDFAFWMQKGYQEGAPETGPCRITFAGVVSADYPDDIDFSQVSLLGAESDGPKVTIFVLNDITDTAFAISVIAREVRFKPLSQSQE